MNNVPNLRFKEFSGEWESQPLSKLGTFFKGTGLSKADLSDEGNPCVLYGELYTKYTEVITNVKSKTNVELGNAVIGKINDVLIPSSGETAVDIATASCLQQDDVILGGDLNVFRSNQVNGIFTSYQLNTSKKFEIAKLAQGASVVHVYNDQLKKLKLSVPTIEEQEKIASFFSLIDKKIELQTEKVEELKNYKKGIMQKIFSQELRFKDENGNEYPEWEEKKLEKIVEFFKGNGLSKSDLSGNGDIPCILYGELFTKYDEVINIVKSRCLKDQGFKSEKYDVLMPTSDVTPEGLATASCILVDDVCLGGDINVLRPKKYINGIFLSYQINHFKSLIIRKVSGTTIKHIYVKDIKDIKYNIPCEKEQIKITDLLIQIDNKIKFESIKLESYNELKKGLLQQMFI